MYNFKKKSEKTVAKPKYVLAAYQGSKMYDVSLHKVYGDEMHKAFLKSPKKESPEDLDLPF